MNRVTLVSAARTPLGAFCGRLESLSEQQLGAAAMRETVRRAAIDPAMIDEVIVGIAKQTSRPSNGGRHAMLLARLPESIPAYTVQRQSASGLQAIVNGLWAIRCGDAAVVLAGGMESMSQIPFEIRNEGAVIMVPKDKVTRLRMKLAESNLPKGGSVGYEIFDKKLEDCRKVILTP